MGDKKELESKRFEGFRIQEIDQKEGIDNSALVVGLYNRTLVFQLQISLPLICHLDVLRM